MDDGLKEYLKQYQKENLKRISLNVKSDFYDKIKLAAQTDNMSVSRYIKSLIAEDMKKKEESIAYKMVIAKNNAARSPLDYYKDAPQKKTEKVFFDDYDVAGRYAGTAVAFLTPEEAAKYREAQKKTDQ